jgi:Tfp pilus assembly protein PilP
MEETMMKATTLLAMVILTIALYGCKGGQEEDIQDKLDSTKKELSEASSKLNELESEVSNFKDTNAVTEKNIPQEQAAVVETTIEKTDPDVKKPMNDIEEFEFDD